MCRQTCIRIESYILRHTETPGPRTGGFVHSRHCRGTDGVAGVPSRTRFGQLMCSGMTDSGTRNYATP